MQVIEVAENGGPEALRLVEKPTPWPAAGQVLIEVKAAGINFADMLARQGVYPPAPKPPFVPGFEVAGIVASLGEGVSALTVGQRVMGSVSWAGYADYAILDAHAAIPLPDTLDFAPATALLVQGLTAWFLLDAAHFQPGESVLVNAAAGGVGSVAVALLAKLGYPVTASTGRPETHAYLAALGARAFIDRAALSTAGAPLQKERWAGGIDSVGGQTLVNVLAQTIAEGSVAACGLAGGADLPGTVLPFILRGVNLLGINSVMVPQARREFAWSRLARDLPKDKLAAITQVEPMSKLPELAEEILRGGTRGRVVIDVNR